MGREKPVFVQRENWVVAQDAIRLAETTQDGEESYCHREMATGRISSDDDLLSAKPELRFGLRDDPYVSLVAVVLRIWVGVLWGEPIVYAENRNTHVSGPLDGVVRMDVRVLAHEASPVEVDDYFTAAPRLS